MIKKKITVSTKDEMQSFIHLDAKKACHGLQMITGYEPKPQHHDVLLMILSLPTT